MYTEGQGYPQAEDKEEKKKIFSSRVRVRSAPSGGGLSPPVFGRRQVYTTEGPLLLQGRSLSRFLLLLFPVTPSSLWFCLSVVVSAPACRDASFSFAISPSR